MATRTGDLELVQMAEAICDRVWEAVKKWDRFNLEDMGSQVIRSADSIGANTAESHGRYHYGEKIQFLLYARGSLTETQYWPRRCLQRNLMTPAVCKELDEKLEIFAKTSMATSTTCATNEPITSKGQTSLPNL
jgi:four helix bundle protein